MGQTLTHGIYLPDEGERNCYNGLAANWQLLDGAVGTVAEHTSALAGKAPAVHTHTKADITDFPVYGTTAGTICEGNDSRLSNARTPVAHTHGKADITDLFNSANTWTGANTFSDSSPIRLKNDNIEKGVQPTVFQAQNILFKDKNNSDVANIRHIVTASGTNANADGLEFSVANKFANGALDPTGTNTVGTFRIGFWTDGQKYIYNEFRWRSSLIPFNNQTQDIGSSSYQWNNLYAKNYYYNGTAWGLDKLNRWSKNQELRLAELEDYTLPSSEVTTELLGWWGTTNFRGGFGHQYYTNGDEGCRFLLSSKDANNNAHLTAFRYKLNRAGTDSYFYGTGAQNFHLGTSTNKWKTLNGINPGALSLPNLTANSPATQNPPNGWISIDTTNWNVSGGFGNAYIPASDGWLHINIKDTATNSIFVFATNKYSASVYGNGSQGLDGRLALMMPVLSGVTYAIIITAGSISEIYTAKFFPCKGNV